jgi:hypothetical protein
VGRGLCEGSAAVVRFGMAVTWLWYAVCHPPSCKHNKTSIKIKYNNVTVFINVTA